ncbi:MAG TPA: hypothetical protein VK081_07845 [Planctomycetota bacterium]|nr:hypothetical protein [Planctomycetota bacterium]
MSETHRGVIRAHAVRRIDQPAFVADGCTPSGGMTVVPIVEHGRVAGIEVRCRCGESVLIECVYEEQTA